MKAREEKEKLSGKKPKGKTPQPPKEVILDTEQINLTDEESRIMPVSGGGFEQCTACNFEINPDIQASKTILKRGLESFGLGTSFVDLNYKAFRSTSLEVAS